MLLERYRKIVIEKLKKEYLGRYGVMLMGLMIIIVTISIALFLVYRGVGTFITYKHSVFEFLFSSDWRPADDFIGGGTVGAAIFIFGSFLICFLALLVAVPFSLAVSAFMGIISPKIGRKFLQPVIEIFSGIPSVVYGWVGLTVLIPKIASHFHLQYGFSVLAGALVLAIMIFPSITSVAVDAIRNAPISYHEASYALGSTRWQLINRVILPSAAPGIVTGIILGLTRAFGETLAVAMVIGKMQAFPKSLLSPTYNLTSEIAADMGNTANGGEFNSALWSMALLLFIISLVFIMLVRLVSKKGKLSNG